jgi:hypothetical protein
LLKITGSASGFFSGFFLNCDRQNSLKALAFSRAPADMKTGSKHTHNGDLGLFGPYKKNEKPCAGKTSIGLRVREEDCDENTE